MSILSVLFAIFSIVFTYVIDLGAWAWFFWIPGFVVALIALFTRQSQRSIAWVGLFLSLASGLAPVIIWGVHYMINMSQVEQLKAL